jgi:two-component system, chemotaxis family, chemotaxis protein CheY
VRLRIIQTPPISELDGVRLGRYRVGLTYEVPTRVANLFLAEGWAAPAPEESPAFVLPQREASAILVVEDDADMRAIAVELLSAIGNPVVAARNGQEALRLLRERRPALVLLDLMMPVMNGWQFCSAQRQLADRELASVPVVLLTAVPDADRHRRELRAVDVITKPIEDLDIIVATVKRWLKT